MDETEAIAAVMRDYPRIFFACHRRHVRDPRTRRLVSERQVEVLDHLDLDRPVSLSELATHLGVTLGTMSVSVERLERQGYIARQADPADRRRLLLRLTEAGARVREARSVLDRQRVAEMLEGMRGDERQWALEGLGLLARAAETLMASRSRGPGGNVV
jgi:DNA-binding MarR family transcriptional regulator